VRTNYIPKFTKFLPFNRKNLYVRDSGVCQYCGKKVSYYLGSFDHVIPRILGGKTNWENVVLACFQCNSKKGAKHPSKFKWPIIMPYAPKLNQAAPIHIINKIAADIVEKSWQDYVYWEILLEK
jgi:5-methylcytosine-specific restriction endonuclease McrA